MDGKRELTKNMHIRSTNSTVGNFYVDVGFFPFFGRVALPDHVSFGGVFVEAAPAFEGGV